jgi:predicted MFS family arabinose efflux permease
VLDRLLGVYRGAFIGLPRGVWWLCLVGFINRSGTMVLPFLALWLTGERGLSAGGAGALLSLYGLGAGAGTKGGGGRSGRVDAKPNQIWGQGRCRGGV